MFSLPSGVDPIEFRKNKGKMLGKAREKAKPRYCIMCGKPQTSFCKSHSVPKMALRSIADNGKVILASSAMGFDKEIYDPESGINNSGIFSIICNKCDGILFQDYEDPDNIILRPTDKILAEIAIKNFLLQISKRNIEKELFLIYQQTYNCFDNLQYLLDIKNMDIEEFKSELEVHKNIVDNNLITQYNIIFWKILPYTVPIAMQSLILLHRDLEDVEVNNIYEEDPNIRMQYLHMAIFPQKNKSVILLFHHKRDKNYRRLRHQINSMSEEHVLEYINYLVFEYTENFFIAKKIEKEIDTNENLKKLSRENDRVPNLGFLGSRNNYGIGYIPVKMNEIPNFLAPEWAIDIS